MRTARHKSVLVSTITILVALPFFAGFVAPEAASGARSVGRLLAEHAARTREDDAPYAAYREALEVLRQNYANDSIDRKKSKDLTYAAIRGMLYSLNDPFTSFLDADQWRSMKETTSGELDGIGALLEQYGQDVRVVRVFENSPALRAGLRAQDIILSVASIDSRGRRLKSESMLGKNIDDVVRRIKGPSGTRVAISVQRKGERAPRSFLLTRDHIEPATVQYWMEDYNSKIGHILLNEFNEKSEQQYDRAYEALRRQGMKALIFDLRNNPGGLLNVAVDIGSRFVDSGSVTILQEKNGQRQPMRVRRGVQRNHLPLVVLINGNSASAAEIVAGAIKDNGAGILVGEHTFGKGLVQTLFPLGDNSALRLTTARYFTPKGSDINNKLDSERRPIFGTGGIKPDIVVKQPEEWTDQVWSEAERKYDSQLKKALEILRTRLASSAGRAAR